MSFLQPTCAGFQDFEIHAVHDFFLFVASPPDSPSAASVDAVLCPSASAAAAPPASSGFSSLTAPAPSPSNRAPKRLKNSPAILRAAPSTSREPICASFPPTCAFAV